MVRRTFYSVIIASMCPAGCGFGDPDDGDSGDSGTQPDVTRLYINEFMARNDSLVLEDGSESTPDWIEIYNEGSFEVDLADFSITDDLGDPRKHVFSSEVVPARGFLLLVAGEDGSEGSLPFKLDGDGDAVGLFDPQGTPLDRVTFGGQIPDVSAGRAPDGGSLGLLPEPTPGSSNPMEFRP